MKIQLDIQTRWFNHNRRDERVCTGSNGDTFYGANVEEALKKAFPYEEDAALKAYNRSLKSEKGRIYSDNSNGKPIGFIFSRWEDIYGEKGKNWREDWIEVFSIENVFHTLVK